LIHAPTPEIADRAAETGVFGSGKKDARYFYDITSIGNASNPKHAAQFKLKCRSQ
jgi:hypothetical protein